MKRAHKKKEEKKKQITLDWESKVYSMESILLRDTNEDRDEFHKIDKLAPILTKLHEMPLSEMVELLAECHGLQISSEVIEQIIRKLQFQRELEEDS